MRKFVPPPATPPATPPTPPGKRLPPQQPGRPPVGGAPPARRPPPATPPVPPAAPPAPYAARRQPSRALPGIALALAVAYVGALVVLGVVRGEALRVHVTMAQGPWFAGINAVHFWAYTLALPAMTVGALLPVFACVRAVRGRSAAVPLTLYAMLQVTLIIVHWSSFQILEAQHDFSFKDPAGNIRRMLFVPSPISPKVLTHLVYSLPLLAMPGLLIPGVRRAFLPPGEA